MRSIFKHLVLFFFALSALQVQAQVTIGSHIPPAAGALLDLKTETDGTSTKGLGLPRVKLDDVAKLKMGTNEILDGDNGGGQYKKHTGLWIYNISGEAIPKCAPIPDGLYVWDGAKWTGINVTKAEASTLTLSGSDIHFPSGLDLRPMPAAETFTATWTPTDKPVAYTNVAHATWGGISFNGANTPPANGNLTTSPTAFSLLANAMTAAEITTNPFLTKQNTLTFKVANECGAEITEVRVVNQTNKALTVQTPFKEVTANSNETNTLTTNADWQLVSSMPNDATNAIGNIKIAGTPVSTFPSATQTDYEQNNNTGKAATLTYDVAVGSTRSRYSILTFADAAAAKRFADVTVTVLQCSNVGQNPSIEQWALTAGFTQAQIDAVKATGTDSPILATGIQMHRVANTPRGLNQIFLSSNFGTNPQGDDQRWMIHNLDAKDYDGVTHSASRTLSGPNGNSGSTPAFYKTAYWAYPRPSAYVTTNNDAKERPTYDNNQRLGLLYTWDAATAGKGGADGLTNVDNGGALQESGRREGNATTEQKRRQGICPSGWHLPSDDEWSLLEQDIVNNKSSFSSLATSTGATLNDELNNTADPLGVNRPAPATSSIYTPNVGSRGLKNNPNGHGNAMKEVCEPGTGNFKGASNGINRTDRPGFDTLLAGGVNDGRANGIGNYSGYWSSSTHDNVHAHLRYILFDDSLVRRGADVKHRLFSVRCKK